MSIRFRSVMMKLVCSRWGRSGVCAACLAFVCYGNAVADGRNWRETAFPYAVVDQDVRDALAELGRNLKIGVDISEAVDGRVRGPWRVATAGEFLDRLAADLDVEWFFDGRRLSVSASEESVRRILPLQGVEPKAWQSSLEQLGIASTQFPIVVDADREIAFVSGPPQYIELVMQSLPRRTEPEPSGQVNVIYGRGNRGGKS